jgi:hypothetical protein
MRKKPLLKIPDLVIILLALALTGFSAFVVYIQPRGNIRVVIQGSNQKWIFPMDAEETVSVPGPLGNTVVRIHGNESWVESSPCANQTCVAMGRANSRGDWVACLPNNVFFIIEGIDENGNHPDSTAW